MTKDDGVVWFALIRFILYLERKYYSVSDTSATDAGPETNVVSHPRGPGRRSSAQFGANRK